MPAQRKQANIWDFMPCVRAGLSVSWTACLLLCAAATVHAQGGSIYGQAISPAGYPVAFASVRICPATSTGAPCTPLTPNVYADPALTAPVTNPYTTDGFGNYSVFVPAGNYYIVQVSFISNQQPYTYAYIQAAASSSVAVAAPQYSIATYTAPGTATTIGESGITAPNGQLRTDAAGGLYVPGPAIFYGSLVGTTIAGTIFNATGSPYYEVNGTQIAAANLLNGLTGTGAVVLANTPTLITPILGVATGTSLTLSGFSSNVGSAVCIGASGLLVAGGCSGTGSVTSFSAGSLSPLFTTSVATATTTPALTFSLSNANGHKWLGNNTGSPAAPGYETIGIGDLPTSGNGTLVATYASAPGASTAVTAFDGNGNVTAASLPGTAAASGYQYLPGGILLQWVTSPDFSASARVSQSVNWQIAFPNHVYAITATVLVDNAVATNYDGYAFYVQPVGTSVSGCSTTTGLTGVCLFGDVGPDGVGDTTHRAYVFAVGN